MTSVRKAVKKAKKRAREHTAEPMLSRRGFFAMLQLFCGKYPKSLSEFDAPLIRRLARLKSMNTRLEREKRKQGKWQEWLEFKAYAKRQQETLLPPWMLGLDYPPTDGPSFERFQEYLQKRADNE